MILKSVVFSAALMSAALVPPAAHAQEEDPPREPSALASDAQVDNIARLVKVWGFVKYHHGEAREGLLAMDLEFFDLYPQVRSATTTDEVDAILAEWLRELGPGDPCDPCAETVEPERIAIAAPTTRWLATLPANLREPLEAIFANRAKGANNFQIGKARGVGNPLFPNEADYSDTSMIGNEATRMLTLARQWNLLRYWFPYRDVMDEAPDAVLGDAILLFLASESEREWHRAMALLAAKSDDGHVDVYAHEASFSPPGDCVVPFNWRPVEDRLVVDGPKVPQDGPIRRGDVVTAIDGVSVDRFKAEYGRFIASSNSAWLGRKLSARLARGTCGDHTLAIERGGETFDATVTWLPPREAGVNLYPPFVGEGPTIETIAGDVTYVRLPQLRNSDLPELLERVNSSAGLVIDIRGYRRDFVVFTLGGMLVDEPTPFVRFTIADLSTPGRFVWTDPLELPPDAQGQRINVPVVLIVNEAAISSAEYHAMAFRAGGARIVGSTTAGADGNASQLPLPDGSQMQFTGIGVFYPDKTPTQRVGIVPDVTVRPTVAGIAEGRDEVLERAIAELRSMVDGES